MKKLLLILLCLPLLFSCGYEMDEGIERKLPPMPEEDSDIPEIQKRNIFVVLIDKDNRVFSGIGAPINMVEINEGGIISNSLKEDVKKFLSNYGKNPYSSENPEKAIISLQNDRGTEYVTYIRVQNELAAAYNELRNKEALNKFGKRYSDLSKSQKKEIKKIYPQKISEAETKPEVTEETIEEEISEEPQEVQVVEEEERLFGKIKNTFISGGSLFMSILSFILLVTLSSFIFFKNKNIVIYVGLIALLFGILATFLGIREAFDAIEAANDISPSLVAGGISAASIPVTYGFIIFIISVVLRVTSLIFSKNNKTTS